MEILTSILVALHLLGMAAIVGSFFVQLRRRDGFVLGPQLAGAITQFVTGIALFGLARGEDDFNPAKYTVHAIIGLIVVTAAIVAVVVQRRGGRVQPWFHTAGGLAVLNLLIAVLWP